MIAGFLAGLIAGAVIAGVLLGRKRRPLPGATGQLAGASGQGTRNGDARLLAIIEAMSEGMALLDREDVVVVCNSAFHAAFGQRSGASLRDETGGRERAALLSLVGESRTQGRVLARELTLDTAPEREVLITATPWSDAMMTDAVIVVAFDVTNLRQAERLRSAFVANVSHELRTPLAAIRGYTESCLDAMNAGEEPPYTRFLPIIHQHALRLNALIEDLLTLSRIESATIEIPLDAMQVAPSVDSAVATLRPQAEAKLLTITNTLPPLLPDVLANSDSVERVVLNLLENAIKYSESGTQITVGARLLSGGLTVFVRDQGLGIPREHQAHVFERFYRVDKARSRKAGGTGLGLSIVKHLVQRMNGEVWVDSTPGEGSTFYFSLPLAH